VKTLGIVGGIGPESTIEYYRSLVAAYRARERDGSYPHVIINSIDMKRLVDLITANELAEVVELLAGEVRTLLRAGPTSGCWPPTRRTSSSTSCADGLPSL
jgi:aspartate racemase